MHFLDQVSDGRRPPMPSPVRALVARLVHGFKQYCAGPSAHPLSQKTGSVYAVSVEWPRSATQTMRRKISRSQFSLEAGRTSRIRY